MPDIPKGYKLTEVGVIPKEWDIAKLSALSAFITKGSTPTTFGFKWTNDGVLFLRSECVSDKGLDLRESMYIPESTNKVLSRSEVHDGDLLITITGNVGRVVMLKGIGKANLNQHIARVRLTKPTVESDFAYQWLSQKATRCRFESITTGQAYPQLSLEQVRDIQIPLPPTKAEQEAIATALGDADALIESLERLIAKKRQIKQGTMQELLTGKRRLPGFSGKWEAKRLGDVCRITTGKKDVNEGNSFGQFPFFTCSRAHTFSDSYSFDTEAILVAGNGEVGNLHYFNGKFEAYQRTYVLTTFSIQVSYLWQQLSARLVESLGIGKIGSSIPYIKKEDLCNFELLCPHKEEQTAIAEVLSDMDAEIKALEARLSKARLVKQGMMQELLTGKIRLV